MFSIQELTRFPSEHQIPGLHLSLICLAYLPHTIRLILLNVSSNNYKLNRMHIALSPNLICFEIGDIIVKRRDVKNGPETKGNLFLTTWSAIWSLFTLFVHGHGNMY